MKYLSCDIADFMRKVPNLFSSRVCKRRDTTLFYATTITFSSHSWFYDKGGF